MYSTAKWLKLQLSYVIFMCLISIIANANPFEDARVEEHEELLESEGKYIFWIRHERNLHKHQNFSLKDFDFAVFFKFSAKHCAVLFFWFNVHFL